MSASSFNGTQQYWEDGLTAGWLTRSERDPGTQTYWGDGLSANYLELTLIQIALLPVSGVFGAAQTFYYLIGNDSFGNRLWISEDFESFQAIRSVSSVGALVFTLPGHLYTRGQLKLDGLIELWRVPQNGDPELVLETVWFLRQRLRIIRGGQTLWKVTAYDGNYLLGDPSGQRGRIIAYNEANAFTDKLDEADNLLKAFARENIGSLATDSNRNLSAYLSIQGDVSKAPIIRKQASRRVLLPVFQEICQSSLLHATTPTYLAFDIVCLSPPSQGQVKLELRTYTAQRGTDRRSIGGTLLIGPDFGNMDDIELTEDFTDEENFIYGGGQSVGTIRAIQTAQDDARIRLSPWNRREAFHDFSSILDPTALADEARSALRAGWPRTRLDGTFLDSPQVRYGRDWNWGDLLPAQVEGRVFNCQVDQIELSFSRDEGETIRAHLRGEQSHAT